MGLRSASENLEIIRLVEEGHLSTRPTLAKRGIPRILSIAPFGDACITYRSMVYDRYLQRVEAELQDQSPKLKYLWNRLPDEARRKVVKRAGYETACPSQVSFLWQNRLTRYFSTNLGVCWPGTKSR